MLFNVLRAYSNYDKEIGYLQGMNYIVANILIHLEVKQYKNVKKSFGKKPEQLDIEEKCFWLFVFMNWKKNYREMFKKDLVKLKELSKFLDFRIKQEEIEIW